MGIYDRDYSQEEHGHRFGGAPQMRIAFPKITSVVKWLLIINISIFLVSIIVKSLGGLIYDLFMLDATSLGRVAQVWRLITYQFLHDLRSGWHIFFNMIGLYFWAQHLKNTGAAGDF